MCRESRIARKRGAGRAGGLVGKEPGDPKKTKKRKIRNLSASKPSVCFNLVSPIEKAFDGMSKNPLPVLYDS